MEPLLKVINLSKYFGTLPVVQQVSLEVYPGKVLGLAGRSGAGKTALAMLLAGLHIPNEGEMVFAGKRCRWPFRARTLGIEVIHQKPELVESLDICSNIFMGNEMGWPVWRNSMLVLPQRRMDERAAQILEYLDVSFSSLHEKVANLSSEQRQMIAIARTLVHPAKLIIVDDPTALLSYPYQQKLLSLIQTWQQQGRAVIFSSNNLDHLFAVTDEIVVLRQGLQVAHYRTDEVSREEVVAALVGTTDQQQITPIIWALDSYYRARERAEQLRLNQTLLERDLAARDRLNQQLINEQVKALNTANVALQDAHRRLLTQREQERKYLARELHDQTIQDLLSVNYQLEAIEAHEAAPSPTKDKLQSIRSHIRRLIEDLRHICGNLRPPTLDSLGLGIAIKSYVNEWSEQTRITVTLNIDPTLMRLPEPIELSAFRIVQEGLRNVDKHAQATAVQICLKHTSPRSLMISISDNGVGLPKDFDLSLLSAEGHYGLLGISERVVLLGGHLSLQNQTGSGLILQAEIPHPRSIHSQ